MERLTLFHLRRADRTNGPETRTIIDQMETESLVSKAYYEKLCQWKDDALRLFKINHINYLNKRLFNLPMSFEHLDASQPWLAYWIVHALRLLNFVIPEETSVKLISFLASSQVCNLFSVFEVLQHFIQLSCIKCCTVEATFLGSVITAVV